MTLTATVKRKTVSATHSTIQNDVIYHHRTNKVSESVIIM